MHLHSTLGNSNNVLPCSDDPKVFTFQMNKHNIHDAEDSEMKCNERETMKLVVG
jgi:hypothetical protein